MADGGINLDWINVQVFEPILEKELNLNKSEFRLQIKSIKLAVGNGENYVAIVNRVQVEVSKNNDKNSEPKLYSFIVKSPGDTRILDDWIEKEVLFYSDVVPKLNQINSSDQYIPKSYSTSNELKVKYKSVIVEDLKPHGYKMLNRLEGLDLEHCKLFYKKLGGYHALTASCYEKTGSFGPRFNTSNYSGDSIMMYLNFISTLFPSFIEIFTKYENLKPYHDKVKKWEHILSHVQAVTEPNFNAFIVLCHGDSWTNNILYLHDENSKPKDVILVDHQLTVFGTPALDILYFFITSPTIEVRDNNFDELIQIYHDSLVEHLDKYKYFKKIPTLRELHLEIFNSRSIACFLTMSMLAFTLLAADEAVPISVALGDTEAGKKIRYTYYNSHRYLKAAESVLKFLDRRGLFI